MASFLRSVALVAVFAVSAVGCTMQSGSTTSSEKSTEGATESAQQNDFAKLATATVEAKFDRWVVSPGGHVGGMLLDDGSVVRIHRVKDTKSLTKGDALHVEGKTFERDGVKTIGFAEVKKDGAVVFAAPTLDKSKLAEKGKHEGGHHKKGDKHGKKHHEQKELSPMSADGTVEAVIPHGFVLSDGTFVYAPHKADLASLAVKKGDAIKVSGKGGSYEAGKAMVIDTITANGKTSAL